MNTFTLPRFGLWISLLIFITSFNSSSNDATFHGFVAQGVIYTSDNAFVTDDAGTSFELTEVGLNASYRFNDKLRVAAQAVYINGGNRNGSKARFDYLFLDWKVADAFDWQVNMHLGRYKNYHWLYSATRDVPHTRPSIILPQSIYFDGFRDLALGSDGVAIKATKDDSLGEWEFNASYGVSEVDDTLRMNILTDFATGNIKQDFNIQASIFWRPSLSASRWGLSILDSKFSYEAGESDLFFDGDATSNRALITYQYSGAKWEHTSEFMLEHVTYTNFLQQNFKADVYSQGLFLQSRYFLNDKVSLMARIDLFDLDKNDRNGEQQARLSGGQRPAYFGFMDQATIGVKWQLANNVELQAEFHRVKGAGRLTPVLIPDVQLNNSKYWNMAVAELMYWF